MYVYMYKTNDNFSSHIREGIFMNASVSKVPRVKTPNPPDVDARWSTLDAMTPAAWSVVAARVSVCLECLGPALLSDEELAQPVAAPRCRRCLKEVAA